MKEKPSSRVSTIFGNGIKKVESTPSDPQSESRIDPKMGGKFVYDFANNNYIFVPTPKTIRN